MIHQLNRQQKRNGNRLQKKMITKVGPHATFIHPFVCPFICAYTANVVTFGKSLMSGRIKSENKKRKTDRSMNSDRRERERRKLFV